MIIGTRVTLGIHLLKIMSRGSESNYVTLKDGLDWYRKGIRDEKYVIDYSADGGATWTLAIVELETDEDSIIISIDNGITGYRHLVRDSAYVIDHALTPLAFEGVENTDWEVVYSSATI
jgi:hypothetical protein